MTGQAPAPDLSVYLVADAGQCADAGRSVPETVAAAVEGGVSTVQLRAKEAGTEEFIALALAVGRVLPGHVPLIINDRVDVAVEARERGARVSGVHVGQGDLAVENVRRFLGAEALVGLSAATEAQLAAARDHPARVDYVGIGTVRATGSKGDAPPGLGIEGLGRLAAGSPLPAVAIGGIVPEDLPGLRDAGLAGAAVLSWVCQAPDPRQAARELRSAWERGAA